MARFLALVLWWLTLMTREAVGDLYGTDAKLRASFQDEIPAGALLPGAGLPPPLSPDFVSMRNALDNLLPKIRKAGRRPLPGAHSSELPSALPPFDKYGINVTACSTNERDNETAAFTSGHLSYAKYTPLFLGRVSNFSADWQNRPKMMSPCQAVRWNYELALTHIPNLILHHLGSTMFNTDEEIPPAMNKLLLAVVMAVGDRYTAVKKNPLSYFLVDETSNGLVDMENITTALKNCDGPLIFPYQTLLQSVWFLRNMTTVGNESRSLLADVVGAASNCLGGSKNIPDKMRSCLDFSRTPEDIFRLNSSFSVFGSEELCRAYLIPDIKTCLQPTRACSADENDICYCTAANMVTLSVFARNFYLCSQLFPRKPFDELDYVFDDSALVAKQNEIASATNPDDAPVAAAASSVDM